MDGEADARALWEVAVEGRHQGRATCQHLYNLLTCSSNPTQQVVVGQHTDNMTIGDRASQDIITDTTTVLEGDIRLHGLSIGICHQVARVRLFTTNHPLVVLVGYHEGVVCLGYHTRGSCLHHLPDAVRSRLHLGILGSDLLGGDQLHAHPSVGGDQQFTDVIKLRTCLGHDDVLTLLVLHHVALNNRVGMSVEHNVDALCLLHDQV